MDWGFVFLMFALKIPLLALCLLVWWAIKQTPEEADQPHSDGGGGSKAPHPHGPLPRHPRRGPHGDPLPASPPRVRTVIARVGTPER